MSGAAVPVEETKPRQRWRPRPDWPRRLLRELVAFLIGLVVLAAAALVLLDTAPGHRFIADRIAGLETQSGLKIRIGRIEGSIFGKSRLKDVAVSDGSGVFLTSPEILLDWSPGSWLYNSLYVDALTAGKVTLGRLPRLRATERGPTLPDFDIFIGRLNIDRLEIGPAVTGKPRVGRVEGSADVRAGRAMVQLRALVEGGDRIAVALDAEPDRNRFDLDARVVALADGVLPTALGLNRAIDLTLDGDGNWTRWRGSAVLNLSGRPTARLALGADSGKYRLGGDIAVSHLLTGKAQRLTAPKIRVQGNGQFRDTLLDGQLSLASPALRAVARGAVDVRAGRYGNLRVGVDLLRPNAFFPNMAGRQVRLVWTLHGTFDRADYSYRLTSPAVRFDTTGFIGVRAEGRGRLGPWPMRVPLRLTARGVTGVGDTAGAILANARLEGMLTVTPKLIRGDDLKFTSAQLSGKLSLLVDLVSGRFEVLLSGGLKRYLIPGLGIVDVLTDLRVVPTPGGRSRVVGSAKAWVRRLDNSFFQGLTGGLPMLTTDLERGPDGILRFSNLRLQSPKLMLTGSGYRNHDGSFHIDAAGRQAQYGPLRLVLDGPIERPRVDLLLARPNQALGLSQVRLQLVPTAAGFDYRAAGSSRLGPFTSDGAILLRPGARPTISIAAIRVAGTTASGVLRSDPGGFSGMLQLAGGGIGGNLIFSPAGNDQRIEAHLTGRNASLPGLFSVGAGRVDGAIILADGRTSLDGSLDAQRIEIGNLSLARLVANGRLVNGSGEVRASFSGQRGAAFSFNTVASISPDRISVTGGGQVNRQRLQLREAAVLTRSGDGWALAPTDFLFAGGGGTLSGRSGSRPEVHAELRGMPLQILDVVRPGLGLSGLATGRLDYAWQGNRSGRIDLRIRGLSKAGLVLSSKPIDLGIAAVVADGKAAVRAVAVSNGQTVGRAQARFAPLGSGPLVAELLSAPLFAQLRYSGPADTLWRLTGNQLFDLSGPLAIGADVGGRMAAPVIRGLVRTQNARLDSPVTGMALAGLNAEARFSGPQLVFTRLSGQTSGGGTVQGGGSVTFAGGRTALNLSFTAARALLLDRDDVAARVSGPLQIRSDGQGGTISGDLRLDHGRFQLGRASAAASVPQLQVRHRGLDDAELIETAELRPWTLKIGLTGSNLQVTGLGINSRWRTELDIAGTADAPRFTGQANLVRGDYDFAGRNFRLERGIIRFRGESPPDPQLDIVAEAQVQGLDASVRVGGTGLRPEISFASVPQLPQDELLSRILFGTSITNLSAPEALQLASAVAALQSGSGSLDPINALRRAVGLDRLRIIPADVAAGQRTAISAGKYIRRKLFVEVITDGQGYSATRIEYQVTRWLSILSSLSTIGRAGANVRVSRDY